jgi:preprotein translocase subunit SecA
MFSKLFGKKSTQRLDDKVWLNPDAKYNGLIRELLQHPNPKAITVIVAQFVETFETLQTALQLANVNYQLITSMLDASRLYSITRGTVAVLMADSLSTAIGASPFDAPTGDLQIDFVVIEHHPVRSQDLRIEEFGQSLTCPNTLTFHVCLNEPLMVLFGGSSVQALWQQLKIPIDNFLTHPTISKSIQNAQQKIERQATANTSARSAGRGWS